MRAPYAQPKQLISVVQSPRKQLFLLSEKKMDFLCKQYFMLG